MKKFFIKTTFAFLTFLYIASVSFAQESPAASAFSEDFHLEQGLNAEQRDDISRFFTELISESYQKHQQKVVILIDEYDKPIIDNLENSEAATQIREILKGFYSVLKSLDRHLRFVFCLY